jgi:hypothetical protein
MLVRISPYARIQLKSVDQLEFPQSRFLGARIESLYHLNLYGIKKNTTLTRGPKYEKSSNCLSKA